MSQGLDSEKSTYSFQNGLEFSPSASYIVFLDLCLSFQVDKIESSFEMSLTINENMKYTCRDTIMLTFFSYFKITSFHIRTLKDLVHSL